MRWGRFILQAIGPTAIVCSGLAFANPEPDLPVHSAFDAKGAAVITVEVDPRCFAGEPLIERYLMKVDLRYRSAAELEALQQQARAAIDGWLRFETEPALDLKKPQFTLAFTGIGGTPLKNHDDPVVIQATWHFQLPPQAQRWRVRLSAACPFAAIITYSLRGKTLDRRATLFATESAYWLELPRRE